jgi:hypothetical protein
VGEAPRGTGAVIRWRDANWVLTAAHVVTPVMVSAGKARYVGCDGKEVEVPEEPTRTVTLRSRRGEVEATQDGRVVWYDEESDLALLRPSAPRSLPPGAGLGHDGERTVRGEPVWYCGYGSGLPWNLVRSIVNQELPGWLVVNGEGWYGHSGSGVYVRRGRGYALVGVVSRATRPASARTPVSCVRLDRIHKFLKAYREAK